MEFVIAMDELIVCVKQVADPHLVKFDLDKGHVDNVFYILNPPDKAAVEEAIRIKEKVGGLEVTAITVGPPQADDALRTCLTMGADKAMRVWDSAFDGIDPFLTGMVLTRVIETLPYKMIFCGAVSADKMDGYLGAAIAESLNLPQVSRVTKFEISPDQKEVIVHRRLEKGEREVIRCPLPAVFTVDEGLNEPRYSSLPTFFDGLQKEITIIDPQSLGINFRAQKPTLKVLEMNPPKPRTKKSSSAKIAGLSGQQKLKALISGVTKEKKGKVVSETPQGSATNIVNFMIREKIFKR